MSDKLFKKSEPEHTCKDGKIPMPGFTRKDGSKVAAFCAKKKLVQASLSGLVKDLPTAEIQKHLKKMSDELGCVEVLKKLEFLGRVSQDKKVRENSKEQAQWLRGQSSCKIVRLAGVKVDEPKKKE
jgi:hypothetical protein